MWLTPSQAEQVAMQFNRMFRDEFHPNMSMTCLLNGQTIKRKNDIPFTIRCRYLNTPFPEIQSIINTLNQIFQREFKIPYYVPEQDFNKSSQYLDILIMHNPFHDSAPETQSTLLGL